MKYYRIDVWHHDKFLSVTYFKPFPLLFVYLLDIVYPIRVYQITLIEKPKQN